MVDGCSDNGLSCGVYAGKSSWEDITGNTEQFNSLPLWWPRWESPPKVIWEDEIEITRFFTLKSLSFFSFQFNHLLNFMINSILSLSLNSTIFSLNFSNSQFLISFFSKMDYDNYDEFGGWSLPSMKQYVGDTTISFLIKIDWFGILRLIM